MGKSLFVFCDQMKNTSSISGHIEDINLTHDCIQIIKENLYANNGDLDQTPRSVVSDLDLHC